jgi:DNA-binding transcriptional LysR family regulator
MDFKQIEAFISVAKYKSFSKAANNIFLSQPTISAQISALEKDLNVQLFDRTSKEVKLTSYGETFLDYALDMINTRNSALSHLSSFNNNITGRFTLSASSTPCNSIVPGLIQDFINLYPEVSLNIIEEPSGEIIDNILKFNCEIGIIGNLIRDDRINTYKLVEDELILISSPSLNVPDVISLEETLNYKFIFRERNSGTRKSFEKSLMDRELDAERIKISCEVNSLDTLLQLVKRGVGISIVSRKICEEFFDLDNIKISTFKNLELKRYIYLITNARRTLTPPAKAFFDICVEKFHIK